MTAPTEANLIDITDLSDAALNDLLGLRDDAETITEAVDLWRDARTSVVVDADQTPTERAGSYLWHSALGTLLHQPRRAFALSCALRAGDDEAAALIRTLAA